MKKSRILVIAGLMFASISCLAQDIKKEDVPTAVMSKFEQAYPNVFDIDWEMDGANYKVEFNTGISKDHEVWYDKNGNFIKHKEDISKSDLPQAVIKELDGKYKKYRVTDVTKVTEADNNNVTYCAELKDGKEEWKVSFDVMGKELEKKAK